jgi:hypothetical protein
MEEAVVSQMIAVRLSEGIGTLTPTISALGFPSLLAMYLTTAHPKKLKARNGRDVINGRLVFTLNGLLMHRNTKGEDLCLADFNSYKPDPLPAQPSAGRPLSALR